MFVNILYICKIKKKKKIKKLIITVFSLLLFLYSANDINACETCGCQASSEISSELNTNSELNNKVCEKSSCDKSNKSCCKGTKSSNSGFNYSKTNSYSKTKKCCKSKTKSSCSKKNVKTEDISTKKISEDNLDSEEK
jgi:hypothetical protein